MAQRINYEIIGKIIGAKNSLCKKQITDFKASKLKAIIENEIIDNESMIDILYESRFLPIINEITHIKIYNYSFMQEYITCGYFLYKDNDGNQVTAINNLRLLFKYKSKPITIVKKYYFYKLLEKNFAHLNSIKAKYALEFKVGPIIAKNINYTSKVLVFFIIFIAIFFYMPILFHIANNISYFSQNILKSLLFIRAIRELSSVELRGYQSRHCERPKGAWQSSKIIKKCYAFFTGLLRQNLQFFLAMTVKLIHTTTSRGNDMRHCVGNKTSNIQNHSVKQKISLTQQKSLYSEKMKNRYTKINLEKSKETVS